MAQTRIMNVQIATHSRCNANCIFCPYVESWHHENPGTMRPEIWQTILQQLASSGYCKGVASGKICLYLMQEPLIDPLITDRMEQVYSVFPDTTIELSTNGAALTAKRTEQILEVIARGSRKLDFWISHHGTSSENVAQIMQINSSAALQNVVFFLKRAHEVCNPECCTIVLRGAGYDFSRQITYFSEEAYSDFWDKTMETAGIAINRSLVKYDYFGFHDRAGTLQRTERGASLINYGVVREITRENPLKCARLSEWLHIMYDGSITLCCMDYHREVKLPNIEQMSLDEYFNGKEFAQLNGIAGGRLVAPSNFICTRCSQPTPFGLRRFKEGIADQSEELGD